MYTFVECTLFSPKEGAEILVLSFKNDTYFYSCVCVCTCLYKDHMRVHVHKARRGWDPWN